MQLLNIKQAAASVAASNATCQNNWFNITHGCIPCEQFYICNCESKRKLLFFVNKIMHNFKIGFNFENIFLTLTNILAVFNNDMTKMLKFKNNFDCCGQFNTRLDTKRDPKKCNFTTPI